MPDFDVTTWRLAFFAQLNGPAGDLGRLVTNTLQVDYRLGNADDQTQVGSGRLTTSENAHTFLVDVALHLVDLLIDFPHLLGKAGVGLDQRSDRVVDLLLDQAAHRQEVAANLFEFGVELLGDMVGKAVFIDHEKSLERPVSAIRRRSIIET
ncbi:hypothetical protein D3C72_1695020 [compost metagenome]